MSSEYTFVLGNKLPTICDTPITKSSVAKGPKTRKMKSISNNCM